MTGFRSVVCALHIHVYRDIHRDIGTCVRMVWGGGQKTSVATSRELSTLFAESGSPDGL